MNRYKDFQNKKALMKKAIITLDIINDICSSKGKIARYPDRISENKVIEKINSITSWGRKKECLIIHVRLGFRPHYLDSSSISPIFGKAKCQSQGKVHNYRDDKVQRSL